MEIWIAYVCCIFQGIQCDTFTFGWTLDGLECMKDS